ncbi:MAG: AAA family ATPase [Acidobacteriaceae bacterium]|nr:AAA family ATPase [Acidobacteriaceae bacterium]
MTIKSESPTRGSNRVSTGIAGLDDILAGGWPANHVYLVEGNPGTGKTTLALQFLLEGARGGDSVLYVTLSESKHELEGIAESHGWSLDAVPVFEYIQGEESLRPENEYSALYPSEVEFHDAMQGVLNKVEEVRPARLVFDSLSEIRLLAGSSLRYRRQILALKHFFLHRNCTVLMLDDRTSEPHDIQLQSIAHGVLMLEPLERDYGIERRRLRMAKLRGSRFREGFHDYTIETGGVHVFPRLVASESRFPQTRGVAKSNVPALDALLGGGLPRGTSTLLTGPAGSGKSSVAVHYLFAAAQRGETAALFHFDEGRNTLLTRSSQLGMDLGPFIDSGRIELHQFDPAEISPGEFTAVVRDAVEQHGARVIAIDSLNGFLNAMSGELQLLLQMHELCAYLNQRGVVTLIVLSQSGLLGSMEAPIDVSYLADNVILHRYFEVGGEVRKAISVLKKRTGYHEQTVRELRFHEAGIDLGEPITAFHGVLTALPAYTGPNSAREGPMHGR